MKVKEIKKVVLHFLGLTVLKFFITMLVKTYRIKLVNYDRPNRLLNDGSKIITAFWHGRMLVPWYINRNKSFAALVSKSKDGEILTKLLKTWEYKVIRGSSHIGGKEALSMLEEMVDSDFSVAITPDGPTGPPNKMKAGAVVLAQRKQLPLFLIGTASSNKKVLKSWDKFEVPRPFSKIVLVFSDEIKISKAESRDKVSNLIDVCEDKMNQLQKEAERIVRNDI